MVKQILYRTYVGDHEESDGVADYADDYDEELASAALAQDLGVQIHHRSDEPLHPHELRVQAHQDNHEEEQHCPH